MLFACIAALSLLIIVEVVHVYDTRKHNEEVEAIIDGFGSFFGDQDKEGLTAFDKSVHVLAESIGKAVGMTTVAAMRGSVGSSVKAIEGALVEEGQGAFPQEAMLEAISSALPKKLQKNKVAAMGLSSVIAKALGNINAPGQSNNDNGSNVVYKRRD